LKLTVRRPIPVLALVGLGLGIGFLAAPRRAHAQEEEREIEEDELSGLSLEELMDVRVTSASNAAEKLSEAPAEVIILTRDELEQRGYRQLVDVFDDLPGMDVVKPYGDNWVISYWRGFRGDVQAGFLLLVDGVYFNSLYYVDADAPLAAMPLSNIERIEIVFGPASSVYGANAFMGVVNVITRSDASADGFTQRVRFSVGSYGARTLDANLFEKKGDVRFSLSARVEAGFLDDSNRDSYEFTKDQYYGDRRLWGGFVDNPNLGGRFRSRHETSALDARLYLGKTELAAQFYQLSSGYGFEYPGDKVQNNAVWTRRELSAYARHEQTLFDGWLDARLMVRYRESGIPSDSYFVDGYQTGTSHVAAFSYWQARNSSWTALQEYSVKPVGGLALHFGMKYERKDLTKAYDINGEGALGTPGGYTPVEDIDAVSYDFPDPPPAVDRPENRIRTEDIGVYVQSKYKLAEAHHLHLGARLDGASGYDNAITVRGGYVGGFGPLVVKALYGQAFQEPPPRVLYGGWTGAGSDPTLDPERSQTLELGLSHTLAWLSNSASFYFIEDTDTISTSGTAENLGKRTVVGLDYGVKWQPQVPGLKSFQVWGWYTGLLVAHEQKRDDLGRSYDQPIGDLATHKLHFGVAARLDNHASLSLRGRVIGQAETVPTNPVRKADRYVTLDASAAYRDVLGSGLGLQLSAQNLLDAQYLQPGIADAGAGTTPGTFAANGAYLGGSGTSYFNSLMPQPGFTVMLSLWLER
jgi:outer membrane receptor for ferrienterochelin and colicins